MRVRATRMGYYNLKRVRQGEEFDYKVKDGEPLPTWVEVVEDDHDDDEDQDTGRKSRRKRREEKSAASVTDQDVL